MIGKLYVGPHERLRMVMRDSPGALAPPRLSEIDYAHPRDFAAILEALPEGSARWTNNVHAVDAVPADRVIVLTEAGPRVLNTHPSYPWPGQGMLGAGAVWSIVWEFHFNGECDADCKCGRKRL